MTNQNSRGTPNLLTATQSVVKSTTSLFSFAPYTVAVAQTTTSYDNVDNNNMHTRSSRCTFVHRDLPPGTW